MPIQFIDGQNVAGQQYFWVLVNVSLWIRVRVAEWSRKFDVAKVCATSAQCRHV